MKAWLGFTHTRRLWMQVYPVNIQQLSITRSWFGLSVVQAHFQKMLYFNVSLIWGMIKMVQTAGPKNHNLFERIYFNVFSHPSSFSCYFQLMEVAVVTTSTLRSPPWTSNLHSKQKSAGTRWSWMWDQPNLNQVKLLICQTILIGPRTCILVLLHKPFHKKIWTLISPCTLLQVNLYWSGASPCLCE